MILDFEVYLHGDDPKPLIRLLDQGKVDKAVTFPQIGFMSPDNELHARRLQKYGDRLIGGAWINPRKGKEGIEELEVAVKNWGFKALKLMPKVHGFNADSELVYPMVKKAAELDIEVTIHTGIESGCDPLQVGVLAEQFPKVPIIMDHMGYRPRIEAAIYVARRTDNVYLGTTRVFEPIWIKRAVERAGADKVIFGSNAPGGIPELHIDVIKRANLSESEQELVLGKNLAKILKGPL